MVSKDVSVHADMKLIKVERIFLEDSRPSKEHAVVKEN